MIDYASLLKYPIPPGRQTVDARAAALYALSIGVGQDPVDQRQLGFVDHTRELQSLPFMALVVALHGRWSADPDTGIDAVRLVHSEQAAQFHAPLPIGGEVVAHMRVVDVIDKGEGRGALLYTERELTDATTGARIATLHSTSFLRGNGGFGGPTGPVKAVHPMPETDPDWSVEMPTRGEQALYYRLNGDVNPLHSDPVIARRAGFDRPILHGLCTLGVCGHALLRTLCDYDPNRLAAMDLRFSSPVFPGDTVTVDIWRNGSFRARVAERNATVVNNGKVTLRD